MKVPALHIRRARRRAGFTLLEVSSAMGLMVVLSVALVTMLQQHMVFLQLFRKQSFLYTEAPQIGNLLGRIMNEADHYFVYATKDDAMGAGTPLMTGGKAIRLFFKTPTQETEERIIAVEPGTGGRSLLKFYGWRIDGTATSWTISDKLGDAEFLSTQGILNMTLEGPNGEEVTFGGGAR